MEYICTYCGKQKGNASDWLLGFEGRKSRQSKSKSMKGAINLLNRWDEQRANEPNAIYFCSTSCQTRYLAENYGDDTWVA